MSNLIRNCIYQGKNYFRDSGAVFWTILFPVILAFFFNLAFGGMMNITIDDINVGISRDNQLLFIFEEIEDLNLYKIDDDSYVNKLENEEIDGYIDEDMNLIVSQSGINQTIIKEILEQIKQIIELNRPIDGSEFEVSYISQRDQESNSVLVIFYSLIAMVTTYGLFGGIQVVSLIQANLSNIGIRLNVTPLKKESFLLAGTIVAFVLNILSNIVLLLFIKYILQIELFDNFTYSFILMIVGNLFGVALGIFIGASNNKDGNTKTSMGTGFVLFLSFLSGLMGPSIKTLVDETIPILGRINPISIVTNNLYRINMLGSTKSFGEGIGILGIYIICLLIGSYLFLRGKSYDSL